MSVLQRVAIASTVLVVVTVLLALVAVSTDSNVAWFAAVVCMATLISLVVRFLRVQRAEILAAADARAGTPEAPGAAGAQAFGSSGIGPPA